MSKYLEPPSFEEERKQFSKDPVKPLWWDKMYNRDAKKIPADVWSDLMSPVTRELLITTIRNMKAGKAACIDGTSIDL